MKDGSKEKHVLRDGVWVRSPETVRKMREIELRRVGVPEILLDEELGSLRDLATAATGKRFSLPLKPDISRLWWVHGAETSRYRMALWTYALRAYVEAKRTARHLSLSTLVDAYFDRDERSVILRDVRDVDCLVFELDMKTSHKMIVQVFAEVFVQRSRRNGLTIFVSVDDIGVMTEKYGEEIAHKFAKRSDVVYLPVKLRKAGS